MAQKQAPKRFFNDKPDYRLKSDHRGLKEQFKARPAAPESDDECFVPPPLGKR
jgi:hypothetical protein